MYLGIDVVRMDGWMGGWVDGWMDGFILCVCVFSWLCTMHGFSIGGLNKKHIVIYCYLYHLQDHMS